MLTYIGFDIEILEVKGVLPDINTNDRDMGKERILVSRRDNLETLCRRIEALQDGR